jgi:hypothetical protein
LIDFRYHLVSIVAVFLALAIGIVLGSTALQGTTIDGLKGLNNSLNSQLSAAEAERDSANRQVSADEQFLQTATPTLLKDRLAGQNLLIVAEPGASSEVMSGVQAAAKDAGATVTGTISLQPKFNDLSGASQSSLYLINSQAASAYAIPLSQGTGSGTVNQQDAAAVLGDAVLQQSAGEPGLAVSDAQALLKAYAAGGFISYAGTPYGTGAGPLGGIAGRATLAVIVTAPPSAADGPRDPADEVLQALAGQFALLSIATLVAGKTLQPPAQDSPILELRGSSVASQVSSVDNADTATGQIAVVWALQAQAQGGKPGSYGLSADASAISPVPSPVPTATPAPSGTPTATSARPTGKAGGK